MHSCIYLVIPLLLCPYGFIYWYIARQIQFLANVLNYHVLFSPCVSCYKCVHVF